MKKTLLFLLSFTLSAIIALQINAQNLPSGWSHTDIGTTPIAGTATYNSTDDVYTLTGSGLNWWDLDDGHFAYVKIDGDFEFEARVVTYTGEYGGVSKAGINARNDLTTDGPSILIAWETWGGLATTGRTGPGATPSWQGGTYPGADAIPWYVKMTRVGNVFYTFESFDYVTWVDVDTLEYTTMLPIVYVGLAIAPNAETECTVTFDNVNITGTIWMGVDKLQSGSFNRAIYPNPVQDELHVNLENSEKLNSFSIIDITGSLIMSSNEINNNTLDVSTLTPGVYFLNVVTNERSTTNKFICE